LSDTTDAHNNSDGKNLRIKFDILKVLFLTSFQAYPGYCRTIRQARNHLQVFNNFRLYSVINHSNHLWPTAPAVKTAFSET
jgi:hypothetical protein